MSKRELKLISMLIKTNQACWANDTFKQKVHNEVESFLEKNYDGKFLKYIHSAEEFEKMFKKTITSIR